MAATSGIEEPAVSGRPTGGTVAGVEVVRASGRVNRRRRADRRGSQRPRDRGRTLRVGDSGAAVPGCESEALVNLVGLCGPEHVGLCLCAGDCGPRPTNRHRPPCQVSSLIKLKFALSAETSQIIFQLKN